MSESVLIRPVRPWFSSLQFLRIARTLSASHGRLVNFRGKPYGIFSRGAPLDFMTALVPLAQASCGLVVAAAPDREQWVIFAWQDASILCLRMTDATETEATLRVLALQRNFVPEEIHVFKVPASLHLQDIFSSVPERSLPSGWAQEVQTLPSVRQQRNRPALLVLGLGLAATVILLSYHIRPEPSGVLESTEHRSIDHQLEQSNTSVVDLLRHHQVLIEQLSTLPGWAVEQVGWMGTGFAVQLLQQSGDLHDLHQFTQGSAMQLQTSERGRVLFWPVHLSSVAEHANLSLMATVAQGDWIEDLVRTSLPSIQVHRDFMASGAGDGWHAQRMILRFQQISAVDLQQLTQILHVHPVRLVAFQYRQVSPDNVYLGYQGHLTFDYFGVSP
ncbi:hypothetical protein [Aliidiomarina indica]|uniref:hypothetical protein n=1 Tax=Aliidiomarina indica TaxID=2749147 RepID=UPI00188F54DC|nr:hypothetical protein [Aliidiomarina indica]